MLGARESAFLVLEDCGDDTLEVSLAGAAGCRLYVADSMVHVRATVGPDNAVRCAYGDPLASLLIAQML